MDAAGYTGESGSPTAWSLTNRYNDFSTSTITGYIRHRGVHFRPQRRGTGPRGTAAHIPPTSYRGGCRHSRRRTVGIGQREVDPWRFAVACALEDGVQAAPKELQEAGASDPSIGVGALSPGLSAPPC